MTYDYTDKELNVLNQEGYVYSVNPDVALKSKIKHKIITDKKDEELSSKETNTVRIVLLGLEAKISVLSLSKMTLQLVFRVWPLHRLSMVR